MAAGDIIIPNNTITPEIMQKIAAEIIKQINTNTKDPGQWEVVESTNGITSLPVLQVMGATYKLVRVAISTFQGVNGREVELQMNAERTAIQWRYVAVAGSDLQPTEWKTLIDVSLLKGDPGETPEFRQGGAGLEWKYKSEGEDAWRVLVSIEVLKLKFSDLTEDNIAEFWRGVPSDVMAEFQKPAQDAADKLTADVEALEKRAETVISEVGESKELADTATKAATDATALANKATGLANEAAGKANTAAENADQKAVLADAAAGKATASAGLADEKAGLANTAAENADRKAVLADAAARLADTATGKADKATEDATNAMKAAIDATVKAEESAGKADNKADLANTATGNADRAIALANAAAENADRATGLANDATQDANTAAGRANTAAGFAEDATGKADKATELANKATDNANVAAKRANAAAAGAENIVKGFQSDWNVTDPADPNFIRNKPEIPTLSAVPDSATLSYVNSTGTTVCFRIGDEIRVLEDGEYIFYKLYDLAGGVASWQESGNGTALPGNIYLQGANYYNNSIIRIKEGYINE